MVNPIVSSFTAQLPNFDRIYSIGATTPVNIAKSAETLAGLEAQGINDLYGLFIPASAAFQNAQLASLANQSMNLLATKGLETYTTLAGTRGRINDLFLSQVDNELYLVQLLYHLNRMDKILNLIF